MAKGSRSLRFASVADMPSGMARLHREQEQRENARNTRLVTVLKTTAVGKSEAGVAFPPAPPKPARKSKYGAIPTVIDGIRFDSRREAKYYEQLKLRVAAGEVRMFLRQVPFHLPGGTKLVVDFEIHEADGRVRYVDVKGRETPVFRLKKREVEHHYPVEIELA